MIIFSVLLHLSRVAFLELKSILMKVKEENEKVSLKPNEMAKETQMYRTVFWTLWERERVGGFGRMALKHV